jgi:hypothetical protein
MAAVHSHQGYGLVALVPGRPAVETQVTSLKLSSVCVLPFSLTAGYAGLDGRIRLSPPVVGGW